MPSPRPRRDHVQPRTPDPDDDWRGHAACRPGQPLPPDPEWFFPLQGQSPRAALGYCARCPVRAECLADAIAGGHGGVRGGMTESTRTELARTRRQAAAS